MLINNKNREIYGILTKPEQPKKYPVVIFSHGYNGSGDDFLPMAKYLALNGIGSFCYDFCGGSANARSSMPTTDMTIFTEMEDLKCVIKYLQNEPDVIYDQIFLFGGSQGGLVSALVADEIPEAIRGLILMFPALCIADNWNERLKDEKEIPDVKEFWGMKLGHNFFTSLKGFDVFQHIGNYTQKVLIMHGDNDEIVPIEYSKKAQRVYPNAEFIEFPGEGHGFSAEGNHKVATLVLSFVSKILE